MDFELNLSVSELEDRVSSERLRTVELLDDTSDCYKDLSSADKMVLCHLVRAGSYIEKIHYRLQNEDNLPFLDWLNKNSKDKAVLLTKVLFLAQKDISTIDMEGNAFSLVKGDFDRPGKGFYPKNLTKEEFCNIIDSMLDSGMVEEVKNILSNRSVVVRDDKYLKGIDYVEYFKDEFSECCKELKKAKEHCLDVDFCKYLDLQILALTYADPYLDAFADFKWAANDKTIFEFTITRESYDDGMTPALFENHNLKKKLKDNGITALSKDSIGARIGIVNKEGTNLIHKISQLTDIAKKHMPCKGEYKSARNEEKTKQTVADVDLVALFGDVGAYNGGVTLAENLPNDDKFAHLIGGGNRNVYHRQVRYSGKQKYIGYLHEKYHQLFNPEADHLATICHENTHSLGPDSTTLGKYSHIIEELKADMGMFAFSNEYIESGVFTEQTVQEIIVTIVTGNFLKNKPKLEQAHRVRQLMYTNRFLEEKAIYFDDDFKLNIDYKKVIEISKIILKEVVRLQIDSNPSLAKEYIDKYFYFGDIAKRVADDIKANSKTLNGKLYEPLKDKVLLNSFKV